VQGSDLPFHPAREEGWGYFTDGICQNIWFGGRVKVGSYPLVFNFGATGKSGGRAGFKAAMPFCRSTEKCRKLDQLRRIDGHECRFRNCDDDSSRRQHERDQVSVSFPESVFNAEMVRKKVGSRRSTHAAIGRANVEFICDNECAKPTARRTRAFAKMECLWSRWMGRRSKRHCAGEKNLFSKSAGVACNFIADGFTTGRFWFPDGWRTNDGTGFTLRRHKNFLQFKFIPFSPWFHWPNLCGDFERPTHILPKSCCVQDAVLYSAFRLSGECGGERTINKNLDSMPTIITDSQGPHEGQV